MQKRRLILYVDHALFASYDVLAKAFGHTRSRVFRQGLEAGLVQVTAHLEAEHAREALEQKRVRVSPLYAEDGGAAAAPSVALTALKRFGAGLLRANSAIEPDLVRVQLLEEAQALVPPFPLSEGDLDALVEELFDAAEGDLTPVPGEEPPGDSAA